MSGSFTYRRASAVIVLALLLSGAPAAHHSISAVFDVSHTFTLAGALVKIDWRNPHVQLFVQATDDRGQVDVWVIEGNTPSGFRSYDITKSDFEQAIGHTVAVQAVRAKDGSRYGLLQQITFPDGRSVRFREAQ